MGTIFPGKRTLGNFWSEGFPNSQGEKLAGNNVTKYGWGRENLFFSHGEDAREKEDTSPDAQRILGGRYFKVYRDNPTPGEINIAAI